MSRSFVYHYWRAKSWNRTIWDTKQNKHVPNPNFFARSIFEHIEEIKSAGGRLAAESIEEIERVTQWKAKDKIEFGNTDIWFPNSPRIVISSKTRVAVIWVLCHSIRFDCCVARRGMVLDPGEWACVDGRAFFVTDSKIFPSWKGRGPWPFMEISTYGLPFEVDQ